MSQLIKLAKDRVGLGSLERPPPQFRTQLRAPTIKCVGGKTEGWTIFARDACLDYHNASYHLLSERAP